MVQKSCPTYFQIFQKLSKSGLERFSTHRDVDLGQFEQIKQRYTYMYRERGAKERCSKKKWTREKEIKQTHRKRERGKVKSITHPTHLTKRGPDQGIGLVERLAQAQIEGVVVMPKGGEATKQSIAHFNTVGELTSILSRRFLQLNVCPLCMSSSVK